MPRPFAVIGITFFLTLVILSNVSENLTLLILIISVLCIIPILLIKSFRKPAVLPTACITVIAACIMLLAAEKVLYNPAVALAGENVDFSGKIIEAPQKENDRFYYLIKTDKVKGKSQKVKIRFSSEELIDAQLYDSISTKAKVYVLGENNEDSLQYYKTTGVYLGAYSQDNIILVQNNSKKPVIYYIKVFKLELIERINNLLPNENGALIVALLFGDKTYLSDKAISNFSNIGISHIMAVSGLNLSMFSLLLLYVFEKTRLNKRIVYGLSIIFVLIFMALAGFSASVLRAGFMLLVIFMGKLINREADSLNSIGLAVLLIAVINPIGAAYVGLQLSFFATLGIITAQKRLMKPFELKLKKIRYASLIVFLRFVLESLVITVAASLYTLPVILIYFKKLSLISVLSNLVVVYTSSTAMILGGIAAFCSMIPGISVFAYPLSIMAGILSKFILKSSEILADLPYASININGKYVYIWLSFSLIITALAVLMGKNRDKDYFRLTAILCSITLTAAVCSNTIYNHNTTRITVVDAGNASAVLISKQGKAALIGCGGDRYSAQKINRSIESNNTRQINLMLIPRTAATESEATMDILLCYKPEEIILPNFNDDLGFLKKQNMTKLSAKHRTSIWPGTLIEYLYTEKLSCAHVEIQGTEILLLFYPGCDIAGIPDSWRDSDILICRSKPPANLDNYQFSTIVISSENPMPQKVADAYKNDGINVFSTANRGNVIIETQGNSLYAVRRAE